MSHIWRGVNRSLLGVHRSLLGVNGSLLGADRSLLGIWMRHVTHMNEPGYTCHFVRCILASAFRVKKYMNTNALVTAF